MNELPIYIFEIDEKRISPQFLLKKESKNENVTKKTVKQLLIFIYLRCFRKNWTVSPEGKIENNYVTNVQLFFSTKDVLITH